MHEHDADGRNPRSAMREAVQFWERRRIWYNAILIAIVALWVVLTWPHFRPAMNLSALGKMCVLAVLANLCYCAAYVAELFMQTAIPHSSWHRVRIGLFVAGMLIAIVLSNYWIRTRFIRMCSKERLLWPRRHKSVEGHGQQHELSGAGGSTRVHGCLRRIFRGDCGGRDLLVCTESERSAPDCNDDGSGHGHLLRTFVDVFRQQSRSRAGTRAGKIFLRDRLPSCLLGRRREDAVER